MSRMHQYLRVSFFLFSGSILSLTTAFAQGEKNVFISAGHLKKDSEIRLSLNWKYHPGDNPAWAGPKFDDSTWKTTNTQFPPQQLPGDWKGIGWFRLHLTVDSALRNKALALNVWQWGASEIYLDGRLIAQYGKVGSSIKDEEGYAVRNPEFTLPKAIVFDQNTDHVLAVRYSNFFLMEKAPNIWHGFQIILRDLNRTVASNAEQRRTNATLLMMGTLVPIVFAVLHLLLFLFYRRAKENLHYAILTLTMAAAVFFSSNFEFSFVTNLQEGFLFKNLGQIFLLLMALVGLRFLYAIFYRGLPKQFWIFLFAYIVIVIWLWDNPFHTEDYANWFAIITNLESIRVIAAAVLQKKNGAWIIGSGFVFAAVTAGSSIVLTGMGILPWNQLFTTTVPVIGIFGLLLSMSIFLARNFARTNKNLEVKLTEVKELSEKTLRQELEEARLKQELQLEQLQAEKLQEIDRMKSRFFANISHEFRTPLTLILGPLEKVLSENFEESVKKQFRVMLRNGRRLLRLINQLLDLSRLEAGRMVLKAKPENIVQLLKGIVLSFSSLAERQQITLKFDAPEGAILVYVDRDKLDKILTNLLSNAFKFTPNGGEIKVEVAVGNSQSDFAEITIKDTGIGIPAEQIAHIFDRFYQVDDSYTRDQEGSGIGLALTKELVELHHGEIQVSSESGKGTIFTVRLPLGKDHLQEGEIITEQPAEVLPSIREADEDMDPHALRETSVSQTGQDFEGLESVPILLIVEDNDDVRSYISDYLKDGYQIIEATDGKEGFKKATQKIPDLIISDVMMPEMDGYELCRKLKTAALTSHIPVILLTARAGGESKVEGLETGADDYIIKPFDARELQVRVRNLIEQRRKLRERFRKEIYLKPQDIAITSMDEQFLQKAMMIIEQNLPDPEFSTAMFANEVAMSRMQLNRKLRALTGHSTHEFIRTYRLQRAAQLLQHQAGTVAEICYDVGFNNLSHFSKIFKEQFGQSPSEYTANSPSASSG